MYSALEITKPLAWRYHIANETLTGGPIRELLRPHYCTTSTGQGHLGSWLSLPVSILLRRLEVAPELGFFRKHSCKYVSQREVHCLEIHFEIETLASLSLRSLP